MCYIAESCHDGFDVFESNVETHYDSEWDDFYCNPAQQKQVAHYGGNGEIQFFNVTEDEQQQILDFVRNEVLC